MSPDAWWIGDIPLLSKGGVDATSRTISRSDLIGSGRGGWFTLPIIGDLNQPPRLRERYGVTAPFTPLPIFFPAWPTPLPNSLPAVTGLPFEISWPAS